MSHSALCEIIDRLTFDSDLTEMDAVCLVSEMLLDEMPGLIETVWNGSESRTQSASSHRSES